MPLLEREREQAKIEDQLTALLGGGGGVLAIEAEAGLGKSALLDSVCASATLRGARVLATSGIALERRFAFGIVHDLLEPVRVAGDRDSRASGLREALERLERDPPDHEQRTYVPRLRELFELVVELTAEAPLVLVIDDAHHADADSLRWLHHIQRRLRSVAVLVALAARPAEPGGETLLLAPLLTGFASTLLRPAPLTRSAIDQFVRRSLPAAAAQFIDAAQGATRGNPFLLEELVADSRDGSAQEAATVLERGSGAIARSIALRMELAPPATDRVLRAAAVLDGGAELRQVAELAAVEPSAATRAVDALTAMRILKPERPLAFEHPLVRAAIYASLSSGERAEAHTRAAGLLADEGEPPERVAAHLLQTEPVGDPWVLGTLLDAAQAASARGAADVAIPLLKRALREPPPPELRFGLLLDLARAEARFHSATALQTLAAARNAANGDEQAIEATIHQARVLTLSGRAGEAVEILETAMEELSPLEHELRAQLESEFGSTLQLVGTRPPAGDVQLHGGELPDRPRATQASHDNQALQAAYAGASAPETAALALEALAANKLPVGDGAPSLTALTAIDVLAMSGQIGLAAQELARARHLAHEQGSSLAIVGIASVGARLELARGELSKAEHFARAGLASAAAHGWYLVAPLLTAVLLDVLVERGDLETAADVAEDAAASGAIGDALFSNLLLAAVGRFEVARGAVREGLECALLAGERSTAAGMLNPAVLPWRSDAARAHLLLGELDQARELAGDELARAEAFGAPRALGVALLTVGLLGGDDAEARLREAIGALASAAASVELARAHVELGALLRRRGWRAGAHHPLRQGLDLAHRCGATVIETRARQELAAIGSRPRRALLNGPEALTPRERVVAEKAAAGRTNQAIAAELFVTIKTVEAHLSSVYRKLGISSRGELTTHLAGDRVGVHR